MDGRRFDRVVVDGRRIDAVTKALSRGTNRRRVLRGAGVGAAGALLAVGLAEPAGAQGATPGVGPAPAEGPVTVVVLYGPPADPAAFEEYYLRTHQPLALQIPHVQRLEAGRVAATLEGGAAPHHRIAELHFANQDDMEAALASPEGQATFADLPNFATGGVVAFVVTDLQAVPGASASGTPTP